MIPRWKLHRDFLANGEGAKALQISSALTDVPEGISKGMSPYLIANRNKAVSPLKPSFFKAAVIGRFSDRLKEGGRAGEAVHSGFNPFRGISNRMSAT
jgi:hypothetical protein